MQGTIFSDPGHLVSGLGLIVFFDDAYLHHALTGRLLFVAWGGLDATQLAGLGADEGRPTACIQGAAPV